MEQTQMATIHQIKHSPGQPRRVSKIYLLRSIKSSRMSLQRVRWTSVLPLAMWKWPLLRHRSLKLKAPITVHLVTILHQATIPQMETLVHPTAAIARAVAEIRSLSWSQVVKSPCLGTIQLFFQMHSTFQDYFKTRTKTMMIKHCGWLNCWQMSHKLVWRTRARYTSKKKTRLCDQTHSCMISIMVGVTGKLIKMS